MDPVTFSFCVCLELADEPELDPPQPTYAEQALHQPSGSTSGWTPTDAYVQEFDHYFRHESARVVAPSSN